MKRLASLDVFRGLTMAFMVVVNNPGDWGNVYPPLLHAFPFFLFTSGVALTLSRTHASWGRIIRRTLLLIGIGILLGGFPSYPLDTIRIPGVLQRIGLCYFFAAVILRQTSSPRAVLAWVAALTLGYWALMLVPPSAGDLTPAGNLGARIDMALMRGHLWKPDWDPEGLLSTIPSVATTLLGAIAGIWLKEAGNPRRVVSGLVVGGAVGIVLGLAWNLVFPINKGLWTSSYVLFTAGMAAMLLALCYALVDAWPSRAGRATAWPFVVLGINAIVLYVLSGLLARLLGVVRIGGVPAKTPIYEGWFVPLASPVNASLLFALANLLVLFLVLLVLYRRRIVLKV